MMISKEKKELIFIISFVVIISAMIMQTSAYVDLIGNRIFNVFKMLGLLGIATKLFLNLLDKEIPIALMVAIALIALLTVIVFYFTRSGYIIMFCAVVCGSYDVDYCKIIKVCLWTHVVWIVFIVASYYLGVVENIVFKRYNGTVRNSIGFGYPNHGAAMTTYTILMLFYAYKEKVKWYGIVLAAIAACYFYIMTNARTAFGIAAITIIAMICFKASKMLRDCCSLSGVAALVTIIGCTILALLLTIRTTFRYEQIIDKIDSMLLHRITLARDAYADYGLSPFGQNITWVGMANEGVYNYVDSSYIQILLNYGIIVFFLIVASMIAMTCFCIKKKDTYMALTMLIVAGYVLIEPHLIWIEYNPFLLVLSYIAIRTVNTETTKYKA